MNNYILFIKVEVECSDGSRHNAVTYFLIKPEEEDRRPSGVYKVQNLLYEIKKMNQSNFYYIKL